MTCLKPQSSATRTKLNTVLLGMHRSIGGKQGYLFQTFNSFPTLLIFKVRRLSKTFFFFLLSSLFISARLKMAFRVYKQEFERLCHNSQTRFSRFVRYGSVSRLTLLCSIVTQTPPLDSHSFTHSLLISKLITYCVCVYLYISKWRVREAASCQKYLLGQFYIPCPKPVQPSTTLNKGLLLRSYECCEGILHSTLFLPSPQVSVKTNHNPKQKD